MRTLLNFARGITFGSTLLEKRFSEILESNKVLFIALNLILLCGANFS